MWFPHQFSITGGFLRRAAFKPAACFVCSLAVLALLAGVQNAALAQAVNGSFHGTVTDPTGAVIPSAQVEVRNLSNGATRDATTDTKVTTRLRTCPLRTTP
jgi:hypothetical protein